MCRWHRRGLCQRRVGGSCHRKGAVVGYPWSWSVEWRWWQRSWRISCAGCVLCGFLRFGGEGERRRGVVTVGLGGVGAVVVSRCWITAGYDGVCAVRKRCDDDRCGVVVSGWGDPVG